jgi:uncharacterized damage-inducible protein DinB
MTEVERIGRLLKQSFEGKAWHGPALMEALDGVTAESAAAPSPNGAHGIWQIVLHATTWKDAVRKWLEGDQGRPPEEENWPAIGDVNQAAWRHAVERLRSAHAGLTQAVSRLDDARLDEKPFEGMPRIYTLLHGVIHHDLYHAGQISLLKKINGKTEPARP